MGLGGESDSSALSPSPELAELGLVDSRAGAVRIPRFVFFFILAFAPETETTVDDAVLSGFDRSREETDSSRIPSSGSDSDDSCSQPTLLTKCLFTI